MSAATKPEHEPDPWAMDVVVLRDKHRPARRVDACEAAARAVVSLLDDPRCQPDGPWWQAVQHWENTRIRKIVRRADGKRWADVQEVAGITVTQPAPDDDHDAAAVRAIVPAPVGGQPRAVNKLQISGTHLPDDGVSASSDAIVTIEINPMIEMTTGKACAQCGHAAQRAYRILQESQTQESSQKTWDDDDEQRAQGLHGHVAPASQQACDQVHGQLQEGGEAEILRCWRADRFRVCVVTPTVEQWQEHTRPVEIIDAGFTEFDGPTATTRAYWHAMCAPESGVHSEG
ncbi:MAG: peptidyl-tRNA hydrolase [Cutibacterium granulosum]|nr:peptidyl-tRNA hydrolase [Cutibacterium granulosum]